MPSGIKKAPRREPKKDSEGAGRRAFVTVDGGRVVVCPPGPLVIYVLTSLRLQVRVLFGSRTSTDPLWIG